MRFSTPTVYLRDSMRQNDDTLSLIERVRRDDPNLEEVDLRYHGFEDLGFMKLNTHVKFAKFCGNPFPTLKPLETNNTLVTLSLSQCGISDIRSVSSIPSLTHLDLHDNAISHGNARKPFH